MADEHLLRLRARPSLITPLRLSLLGRLGLLACLALLASGAIVRLTSWAIVHHGRGGDGIDASLGGSQDRVTKVDGLARDVFGFLVEDLLHSGCLGRLVALIVGVAVVEKFVQAITAAATFVIAATATAATIRTLSIAKHAVALVGLLLGALLSRRLLGRGLRHSIRSISAGGRATEGAVRAGRVLVRLLLGRGARVLLLREGVALVDDGGHFQSAAGRVTAAVALLEEVGVGLGQGMVVDSVVRNLPVGWVVSLLLVGWWQGIVESIQILEVRRVGCWLWELRAADWVLLGTLRVGLADHTGLS